LPHKEDQQHSRRKFHSIGEGKERIKPTVCIKQQSMKKSRFFALEEDIDVKQNQ
jgi:hypothetical protein